MQNVGLLFVGAVLFVNGLLFLGKIDGRSAIPLNVLVGLLQVVTPTFLIMTADGDPAIILSASGLYLFGFTYLYVAANLTFNLDPAGLGYFSLFVSVCALAFAGISFGRLQDPAFGVIWIYWSFLWALFFVLLALKQTSITRYVGAVALIQGWLTCTVPALLLLTGFWPENTTPIGVGLAIFGVVAFGALYPKLRDRRVPAQAAANTVGTNRSIDSFDRESV